MDHVRLLSQVVSKVNLRRAVEYALRDRYCSDHFFSFFELEHALAHKNEIVDELLYEMVHLEKYTPRSAYAYFPPKSDLCFRRMVYLPFKDLAVRYALVAVLADHLDISLSPRCFANRREDSENRPSRFLQDFASVAWPSFCRWQRQCAGRHKVLLRTDISAFYDSISHECMIDTVANALSIDTRTPIMELFGKLLRVPVLSYSYLTDTVVGPEPMHQGLPIGNTTEGFLANLYLRPVDDVMDRTSVEFGRYNDDMRLFSATREDALDAVLVLQQELLGRCLNLNASKTEIAETREAIEKLRSKDHDVYGYLPEYDVVPDELPPVSHDSVAAEPPAVLDVPFDEFDRKFTPNSRLTKAAHAKDFCKFLSQGELRGQVESRELWHLRRLEDVLTKWKGSSRHAAWLLVQTACFDKANGAVSGQARSLMFRMLASPAVAEYAKYRVLHHLVKPRRRWSGDQFRLVDNLTESQKRTLMELAESLVASPAFELALTSLYALRACGLSGKQLTAIASGSGAARHPGPIADSLSLLTEPEEPHLFAELATQEEPDVYAESY